MRAGDLAPDHADLGAADLLGATVDVGDLLAEVEAAGYVSGRSRDVKAILSVRTWRHQCRQHPRS